MNEPKKIVKTLSKITQGLNYEISLIFEKGKYRIDFINSSNLETKTFNLSWILVNQFN